MELAWKGLNHHLGRISQEWEGMLSLRNTGIRNVFFMQDGLLMMETVSSSGTLVNIYQTIGRIIPGNSHLHTRRLENLKSHVFLIGLDDNFLCKYKKSKSLDKERTQT
jgi:hypothetical protein